MSGRSSYSLLANSGDSNRRPEPWWRQVLSFIRYVLAMAYDACRRCCNWLCGDSDSLTRMTCNVYIKRSADFELGSVEATFFNNIRRALGKRGAEMVDCGDNINQERNGTSILVCPVSSRLGSSVDSAMRKASCTGHSRLALLLFHHQPPHMPLVVESDRQLTDVEYSRIGCMVDVVFWREVGVYPCETNKRAEEKLTNFILGNSRD